MTIFIREAGADVWVLQSGVSNMHMATSVIRDGKLGEVGEVSGVERVSPLRYGTTTLKIKDRKLFTYLVGFKPGDAGGPWKMAAGRAKIDDDEVVLDRTAAAQKGVGPGDKIAIFGRDFTIAGLSADTFSLANSITFITSEAFADLRGDQRQFNYLLVKTKANPRILAAGIEREVGDVNAMTTGQLVASDRLMIRQMGIDVINAMASFGFLIGLAVIGLTIYTLTLERTREFAVMKAIGGSNRRLLRIVFEQTALSVCLGLAAGLILALGARVLIEKFLPSLSVIYRPGFIARTALAMVAISLLSAYMPIRRVLRVDPLTAFKK